MSVLKYSVPGSAVSVATSALDSLAGGAAFLSATISGIAPDNLLFDVWLSVNFPSAPTDQSVIELYVAGSRDGTNFEDASTTGPVVPRNGLVGTFSVRNVTSAQLMRVPLIVAPWRDFKLMLYNRTGTAFGTGNQLWIDPATEQSV